MKDAGAVTTAPAPARTATTPRWVRGLFELALILALWVFYSLARLLADTSLHPALNRANDLLHVENLLGINWETPLNQLFTDHGVLGLIGSYWYASLHYVVTAGVLIWLWRLGADRYGPARRALVIGTLLGLGAYLLMPTAPPRFIGGYVDVLSLHAADGWWGADASAPRGLGGLTNELAAFPSLHAGWSLWVALALQVYATRKWVRVLGWAYALGTAVVIVGTGNHWVIDALVGWLVILVGWAAAQAIGRIPLPQLWARRTARKQIQPEGWDATH
jgi:PAP2 superfamily protein